MGDVSAEPSMEEILSSIKRIIAEEGEGGRAPARRPQRPPVQMSPPARPPEAEGVLELSQPIPAPPPEPERAPERIVQAAMPAPTPAPVPVQSQASAQPAPTPATPPEPIVSNQAAAASRGSLDALSRLVVKPEGGAPAGPSADNTLEGMVRDMLRPMLSEWLDARLPEIVEAMVAREIERITGSR